MKKLLACLLCMALLLSAVSFGVSAASVKTGKTGDCTWTLDGNVLTISGNGAMADYLALFDEPWGNEITRVVVEEGVTSIGNWAFASCTKLESVTLPSTLKSINRGAFYNCTSLKNITLPENVEKIEEWAFASCSALEFITLPASLKSIGYQAFDGCDSLKNVYYSGSENAYKRINIASGNGDLNNTQKNYGFSGLAGDVNNDGTVDTTDLAIMKQILAELDKGVYPNADCDRDCFVDTADMALLKKMLAGLN